MYCACWCMTLTWSKVKVKATDLLKSRKLHFSPPFWRGAQNWWLITIVWEIFYSFPEPDFWISSQVGGHVTSKFAKCWYHQNPLGFISMLLEARSLWLWLHVGRIKPCTLAAMTVSTLPGLFLSQYFHIITFQHSNSWIKNQMEKNSAIKLNKLYSTT